MECASRGAEGQSRIRAGLSPGILLQHGFTLLELLVVMGIIAVLAELLLPVLARAKAASRSVACKSNLRQLGVALQTYIGDFGGVYPYTASVSESKGTSSYWFDALTAFLPNATWGTGVFKCPAYEGVVYRGGTKVDHSGNLTAVYAPCGSYAYNASDRRAPTPRLSGLVSSGLGFIQDDDRAIEQPVCESDVCVPATLYAFGDAPLALAPWGTTAALRVGGAADYNVLLADDVTITKPQHATVFNMVLADSHAEGVRTLMLFGTNGFCRSRWNHDNLP